MCVCGLWRRPPHKLHIGPGISLRSVFPSFTPGGKPLVIKSGRAICGHSWNRKAVVGMGEAPKLVGLWQQKLCQCVGSSCVPGRAVHEAPPDVAGEAVREWSLLL